MTEAFDAALAARQTARLESGVNGVNPNTEFRLGWEAAEAAAAHVIVATLAELWTRISESDEAGQELSLRDAGHRYWIIGGDEHGDHWATSFPQEGDTHALPCTVPYAAIVFPATVFPTAIFPTPPEGEAE